MIKARRPKKAMGFPLGRGVISSLDCGCGCGGMVSLQKIVVKPKKKVKCKGCNKKKCKKGKCKCPMCPFK